MRGSVVFLAVFAATSCSVGVHGAHFVKSGITGHGTGRGNEDAPGIGESAFGDGENDGHHIGKRSYLGRDIAERAAFRSAAARRQRVTYPNALFPLPTLPPSILTAVPRLPGPTGPIRSDPPLRKSWYFSPMVKSQDLPLKRAVPSLLERDVRPLPELKFLPLAEIKNMAMKIISNALPDKRFKPLTLPKPSARSSSARGQGFYRSDLKNRRSRYSGLRSYSPLRSDQILPGHLIDDYVAMPLYKHVGNTAPALRGTEENFREEVRSAVVKYLVHLWNKLSKWFKPGSHSGGGTGGVVPPKGQVPIGGGIQVHLGLPPEVHTESPPEDEHDDVIIEPATPPGNDDEIIHLPLPTPAPEPAKDSAAEGGSDVDEDYYESEDGTNWEARHPARMGDGLFNGEDDPDMLFQYENWEARQEAGNEDGPKDVAGKIKDTSAGTRSKNMRDDLGIMTDIFGRRADY